jgi:NAD(P)-dependent dehydrogenase (short-subunit alcohol dehydrogenase family)
MSQYEMACKQKGQVAVVAGATRGAGRGIACALGEAGAIVYCTGRSTRGQPSSIGRPETIQETAEMVTARGGKGIWVRVDHTQPDQVKALFQLIKREQDGRLDVVVNNISGDWHIDWKTGWGRAGHRFWKHSLEGGLHAQEAAVHSHIITSHYAAQLLVKRRWGLIVEINDGNRLQYNNCGLFYSLTKASAVLLAYFMSEELRRYNVAAVALTPGWLRSEMMLEIKGVTEENWPVEYPDFESSESPLYIGRAVVALAADPNVMQKTGRALSSGWLAREYGFVDVDGRQPVWYRGEGTFSQGRFTIENEGD